ncbi:TPA: helix-turn-helix transcriptional regulator, partial [Pasteurella multocida]|nr:helix-turn-helix transcriptional regulator [Pasteurella multocida]
MQNLSVRLRKVLSEKRLSQQWLAEQVGISQQAIGKILNGGNTTKILEIATALGVDAHWLKTGKGSRDTSLVVSEPSAEYKVKVDHLSVAAIAGYNGFSNADYPDVIRSIYFS